MAGASWYRYNTVTVTQGSISVVGVGTTFLSQVSVGDVFTVDGTKIYEIKEVVDDTHVNLQTAYTGVTAVGTSYGILRNFTTTTNAALAAQLTALLGSWQTREDQMRAWLGGSALGGYRINGVAANPAGNDPLAGYYPMSDALGNTQYLPCPVKSASGPGSGQAFTVGALSAAGVTSTADVTINSAGAAMMKVNAAANTYSQLGLYEAGALKWNVYNDFADDSLVFGTAGGAKARITTAGDITIGKLKMLDAGSGTVPALKLYSDNVGFSSPTGADISFITGGATRLQIKASGQLAVSASANNDWATIIQNAGTTDANGLYVNIGAGSTGVPFRVDKGGTPYLNVTNAGTCIINTVTDNGSGAKLQVNGGLTIAGQMTSYNSANVAYHTFGGSSGNWLFGQDAAGFCSVAGLYGVHRGLIVDTSGNVGMNVVPSGAYKLQVNGQASCNLLTVTTFGDAFAPASNGGGTPGTFMFTPSFVYVCVAASGANSWKRAALTTY